MYAFCFVFGMFTQLSFTALKKKSYYFKAIGGYPNIITVKSTLDIQMDGYKSSNKVFLFTAGDQN